MNPMPLFVVSVGTGVALCNVILKVRVVAGSLCGYSTCRIVHKHHLKQFKSRLVEVGAKRVAIIAFPLREGCFEVGV